MLLFTVHSYSSKEEVLCLDELLKEFYGKKMNLVSYSDKQIIFGLMFRGFPVDDFPTRYLFLYLLMDL